MSGVFSLALAGLLLWGYGSSSEPPPILLPSTYHPPLPESSNHPDPMIFWKTVGHAVGIPWTYLAAMNQVEGGFTYWQKWKDEKPWLTLRVPQHVWGGWMHPEPGKTNPLAVHIFGGMGQDANGDGRADPEDPVDVLYSIAHFLAQKGTQPDQLHEQLWNYYYDGQITAQVIHIARIYQVMGTDQLNTYRFPLPTERDPSIIKDNWQQLRRWGRKGKKTLRFHEGIDLFAPHGAIVVAPCYGYIEQMGWNSFGGWRLGIRDGKNRYHYLAHLSGFRQGMSLGDIVSPGEKIGTVGSSGYGSLGTLGKFPAHLHYGLYHSSEKKNYAVNPLSFLQKLQRQERDTRRKKKKFKAVSVARLPEWTSMGNPEWLYHQS